MLNILLKYSSQYSNSLRFSCGKFSLHFFKFHISVTFHHTAVVVICWKKKCRHFFLCDFTIVTRDENTNYKALLTVSRPSNQIQLSISGLLIVMGKPMRKLILAYWNMVGHRLFAREPIGKPFYLHAAILEIPKYCIIIKPPACWGADVSIEIYELLLLFSMATLMNILTMDIWTKWTCSNIFL